MMMVALGLLLGTVGAFASNKLKAPCEELQQYTYVSGMGYVTVSEDYLCINGSSNNCTYWLSNTAPMTYTVCAWGLYMN